MKKLIVLTTVLTICLISTLSIADECPTWVPDSKCQYFEDVLQAARQHAKTLDAPPMVVDAYIADQYLFIVIKRADMVSRVKLGKFDYIKDVRVHNGKIEFEYYTDIPTGKRALDMAIGAIAGFFVGSGLIIVLLLL